MPNVFYLHLKQKLGNIENFAMIRFELQQNNEIDFVENWLCVTIPIFPLMFNVFSSRI